MRAMLSVVLFVASFAGAFAIHQWWQKEADLKAGTLQYHLESPQDLVVQLQETLAELGSLVAEDDAVDSDAERQVKDLITKTDTIVQVLDQKDDILEPHVLASARVAQANAYFIAHVRQPECFRQPLVKLCNQLMKDLPDSPFAFQASAFHFAAEHDLSQPLGDEGFAALVEQADRYEHDSFGAALYSFVSRQLHVRGHDSSAEEVLMAGLARYRGSAGWHDLFQQQFTQGYVETPTPEEAP